MARRGSRNASGPSSTAPPEHNRNRDAAGIPASPTYRPPGQTGDRFSTKSRQGRNTVLQPTVPNLLLEHREFSDNQRAGGDVRGVQVVLEPGRGGKVDRPCERVQFERCHRTDDFVVFVDGLGRDGVGLVTHQRIDRKIAMLIRRMGEQLTRVSVLGFAIASRADLDNRNRSRSHLSG